MKVINFFAKIKILFFWQLGDFFIKNTDQANLEKLIREGVIKNVLIAELNYIGDKLLITPALKAIKQKYPQLKITVIVKDKISQSALEKNPYIDTLKIAGTYSQLYFFSLKNRNKYELLIDFSANFYYAYLLTWAKIPHRIGTKPQQKILGKARNGFGWVYTHSKDFNSQMYITDYFLSLLQFLGINQADNRLEIYPEAKEKQKIAKMLQEYNLKENNYLVLHPGVNDEGKAWALENWQELTAKLVQKYQVIFSGSLSDNNLIAKITQSLEQKQAINFAGDLTIRETAALIAQARAFIGVDTGPLHMAVALNKPTVALFNTTHPQNYLPKRDNIMVLNTPEKCKQHFTLNYIKTKRDYKQNECSSYIKPEQVYNALEKLIK